MEELNTVDKGDASEAAVIAELKKRGKTVLIPFGDNQRYDIVIEDDGFERVQIKTAREKENVKVMFDTAGSHTNSKGTKKKPYSKNEIDSFIIYNQVRDIVYKIPIEEAPNTNMIIRHKPKQDQPSINWAEDYVL